MIVTHHEFEMTTLFRNLGQNDTRVHFGLGMAPRADRLEVRWPAGRSETFQQVQAGAIITIVEGEGITRRVAFRQ